MPLLDRTGWIADPFARDGDEATLVPLEGAQGALRRNRRPIGIEAPNTIPVAALDPWLASVDLIAIAFPASGDGRGFSLGRQLRERGFGGRLRAVGQLIPDQFAFALACGFDEIEIDAERAARQPIGQWLAALNAIDLSYQAVRDGRPSIFARRRAA